MGGASTAGATLAASTWRQIGAAECNAISGASNFVSMHVIIRALLQADSYFFDGSNDNIGTDFKLIICEGAPFLNSFFKFFSPYRTQSFPMT